MQSTQKHKSSRKSKIAIIILALLILSTLLSIGLYLGRLGPFAEIKGDSINSTRNNNSKNTGTQDPADSNSDKTPVNNQPSDDNDGKYSLSANISYVNQTDSSLKIGTVINEVTSSGTCRLTMTQGDKKYTDSAGMQPLASTSTCKGFEIPVLELSKGSWTIELDIATKSEKVHLVETVSIK
jgi:hypothetical protein